MPERRLLSFLLVASLAVAVGAQRPVLTVGGVNPDHVDLPSAVLAAAPGSVIEVRPGTYTGFVTGKPLRIELQAATIVAASGAAYAIEIDSMYAADGFTIVGPGQVFAGALGAVRVEHCGGAVVLEDLTLLAGAFQPALDVYDAANVHLARSILAGMPGLQANLCAMVCSEDVIGGTQGSAAVLSDALFESSRTVFAANGGPALRAFSSQVRLASDGTSALSVLSAPAGVPVAAIEAVDSHVQWLPSLFQLAPANGAPPFVGVNTAELLEEVPMLNAGPAVMGTAAKARLTMATPTAAAIAISYLMPVPIALGTFGLYADPAPAVLVATGVADMSGLEFLYTVPIAAALRGALFCFQGVAFQPSGLRFSGPALWLVH